MREHAEDTLWWSLKHATEFAAHRRTIILLRANISALEGAPNPIVWIDNTGAAYPELVGVLDMLDPKKIAFNVDADYAFAGGMHIGEFFDLREKIGPWWLHRFIYTPHALATAFMAHRIPKMRPYFEKMTEIVWPMLEEAFSERVVAPGKTTTEVKHTLFHGKTTIA